MLRDEQLFYIEFDKIYRQTEESFIRLLNKVRNNKLDEDDRAALNKRYQPDFFRNDSDCYIVLTTHNDKAKEINTSELNKLGGKLFTYRAEIKDDFPETAYPAEGALQPKLGAQVMFIKNDASPGKQYFNGKIGVVTELAQDKIFIQGKDDPALIEVGKETWKNIRYTLDKATRQLSEDELGSFS